MIRFLSTSFILLSLLLTSLRGSDAPAPIEQDNPAMKRETQTLVQLLENYHFSRVSLEDTDSSDLILTFMEELDYNHLFFLQSDYEELKTLFADNLIRDLKRGNLEAPFAIFNRYLSHVVSRTEWIHSRLDEPFDVQRDDTYSPDRSEAGWPSSPEEANELWEKRLVYEILFDLVNDEEMDEAINNVRRRYDRLLDSVSDMDSSDVQEIFLTALTSTFDPHSTFLSSSTLEDFSISMSLSLVGIGALLSQEDGYCVIREIIPGGPAALAGNLHPGDKIVAVAQEGEEPVDVIDMKLKKTVQMIRGEEGTNVYLTIIPNDAVDNATRKTIVITRDEVKMTASRASASVYTVPDGRNSTVPIGVIELPSFYGAVSESSSGTAARTTDDVRELLVKLEEYNVAGIILDLRNNGGGLLSEAIDLAGLFIEKGPVVQVKDSRGFIRRDFDNDRNITYAGPLAVLVSRYSASASEIVAGALQYYNRAIIIGDPSTHGKGTVQAVFEIDRLAPPSFFNHQPTGAAKLTIQKFYLPNGHSTQNRGVLSDIPLPTINEFLPIGEADLPHALSWDEIRPVDWAGPDSIADLTINWDNATLRTLKGLSEKRQNDLEEFQFLKESIEWFKEKQERTAVSLNLDTRKEEKDLDNSFRERMDELKATLADDEYPSIEVQLDEVAARETPEPLTPEDLSPDSSEETDASDETEVAESLEDTNILLREGLRIMADWAVLREENMDPVLKDEKPLARAETPGT